MPYISQNRREALDDAIYILTEVISDLNEYDPNSQTVAGDLNYTITRILDGVYKTKRYRHMNEAIGVLECAKLEFYRRIAAPYEDDKIKSEGDAYEQPHKVPDAY